MKHIVLISSGQPSANPRLSKEAITLNEAGYKVTVVYCSISAWADEYDLLLFEKHKNISWIKAGYHPAKQPILYNLARIRKKFFETLNIVCDNRFNTAVKSMVLFSQELANAAIRVKADLYIGHNLGALPAVVKVAKYHKTKAIFDFEDFHRGEESLHSKHTKRVVQIENKYAPQLALCTTASVLITRAYSSIYPLMRFVTIQNCFSLSYQKNFLLKFHDRTLKLFWFSQYVGKSRGIESILQGMAAANNENITLTLLGNCTIDNKEYFTQYALSKGLHEKQIIFLDAVAEDTIVEIASQHHIGFSAEIPNVLNREFCLTNKIFMYLLAGNAIMFSKTSAHEVFLKQHNNIGVLYDQSNEEHLGSLLQDYFNDRNMLEYHRLNSYQLGKQKLNWEIESTEWKKNIESLLG